MNLSSELLQLLTIGMFPGIAVLILHYRWKHKIKKSTSILTVALILILGSFLLLPNYTIVSVGVIRCPDGQRMVEVFPSMFDRYGYQQSCVADTGTSKFAEWLAHERPSLQTVSAYVTLLVCVLIVVTEVFTTSRVRNKATRT